MALKPKSARVYTRKLKYIIAYLERTVAFFRMDQLLFPMEFGIELPSIASMARGAKTEGERKHVVCTYKYVCQLALELFDQRYAGDSRFSLTDRTDFRKQASVEMATCTRDLNQTNRRASRNAKERQADLMEDDADLTFNFERMQEVARYVLYENGTVRQMFTALTDGSPQTTRRRYTEVQLRNLLISLILASGGGLRPDAVSNMKVGEFMSAREGQQGTFVVLVREHKCFVTHGPQPVPLALDGLHRAVRVFLQMFRSENEPNAYLFQTRSGLAPEVKHSRDWLRKEVLVDFLTPEELRSLKPGTWRKACSNWADVDRDPKIQKIATGVMNHSRKVNRKHYLKVKRGAASKFGHAMLRRISTPRKVTSSILKTALERGRRLHPWVGPAFQRLASKVGGEDEALRVLLDGVKRKGHQ